jgi:NTP pyrophosphatase (non-canonical NTP hydrolase)
MRRRSATRCVSPFTPYFKLGLQPGSWLKACEDRESEMARMQDQDYFDRLVRNVAGLNAKFPDGNDPFQIMTRLCEEAGELAQAVNHVERSGITVEKYGPPNLVHLANEVHHVIRAALAVAVHYKSWMRSGPRLITARRVSRPMAICPRSWIDDA